MTPTAAQTSAADRGGDAADAPRESYRARALRGSALAFGGYGLTQVLNFVAYAALARVVTPHDFGLYAAGAVISGVAMLFAESGMLAALITRVDRLEEAHNTALAWNVVSGVGLVALSVAVSPLVGLAFGNKQVGVVSAALSGVLLIRAMSIVPDALLQRRLSFARRLVVEPLGVVAFGITGIALGLGGAGVWAVVAASYAAMIVRTVLVWAFAHWRPRPRTASFAMWRELTGYARHVVLGELVRRAASQLDVLLVGRFVGIAALGQYRYATRLAQLPLSTWVSVGAYVLLPVFARLAKEPPRLRAATLNVVRWMATAVMPVSLLLFALGLPAAIVVFGEEWKQAGYGVMALSLMPIGLAVVSVASEVFKAIGRPQELPKLHTFHGVASAAAMLALLPFGMFGVAAGASVASLAVGTFAIIRLQKAAQIPARAVLGMLLVPLLAAAWMGGLGYAIDHLFVHAAAHGTVVGLLLLVAETIVLLAVYAATLLLVSRPHRRMFAGIATKARRFVAQRTHRPAPARS